MKKYITLFAFVCMLFLGMQTTKAQEDIEPSAMDTPEIKAKLKTLDLAKTVELTDVQIKQVYEIFLAYEKNGQGIEGMTLAKARKEITNLLLPGQREKFAKTFSKEVTRERKMERGRDQ